jgi:hypothetical protein
MSHRDPALGEPVGDCLDYLARDRILAAGEIFPSDGGAGFEANAPGHRLDEFSAVYSSVGWSPPEPASASPAWYQYAVTLRANIDETESAAIITEQGGQENHRERSQDGNSYCNQFA